MFKKNQTKGLYMNIDWSFNILVLNRLLYAIFGILLFIIVQKKF